MMVFKSIVTDSFPHCSASARSAGWSDDLHRQFLFGEATAIPWIYSLKVWMKHNISALCLSGSRSGVEEC